MDNKKGNPYNITNESVIGDIIEKYPYIREYLPSIAPEFKTILNPVMFQTIGQIATIEMASKRGGVEPDYMISKICERIAEEERKQ